MRSERIPAGVLLGLSLLLPAARGQDAAAPNAAANAAAVAEVQGVDERFKQLAADIDSLRAADEALQDKLSTLKDEMQQIRSDQARFASNAIGPDDLRVLAAKIEEVDKKRMDDNQKISDEIKQSDIRLARLIADNAVPAVKPTPKPIATADAPSSVNGFVYTIKDGDTLDAIVKAYNAEFKSKGMKTITVKQAKEANPTADWPHLKVGQQIVIPRPPD